MLMPVLRAVWVQAILIKDGTVELMFRFEVSAYFQSGIVFSAAVYPREPCCGFH